MDKGNGRYMNCLDRSELGNECTCLLIVSNDRLRLIIESAFLRWGILFKNEFLKVFFIDKVCFIFLGFGESGR